MICPQLMPFLFSRQEIFFPVLKNWLLIWRHRDHDDSLSRPKKWPYMHANLFGALLGELVIVDRQAALWTVSQFPLWAFAVPWVKAPCVFAGLCSSSNAICSWCAENALLFLQAEEEKTGDEASVLSQVGPTGKVGNVFCRHFRVHESRTSFRAHGACSPGTIPMLEGRLSLSVQGACHCQCNMGYFLAMGTFLSLAFSEVRR
jgi:hypothetical protein